MDDQRFSQSKILMNFRSGVPWHELLVSSSTSSSERNLSGQEIHRLLQKASGLYENYLKSQENEDELTKELIQNGTRKDQLASMKVLVQETPLLSLKVLKDLTGMLKSKPRIAIESMQHAMQLYVKHLLPANRPLKSFQDQPLRSARDSALTLFYFEDQLKKTYSDYIKEVENLAKAHQQFIREPAIRVLGDLLRAAPENEQAILTILVDKFGDPLKAVSGVAQSTLLSVLKDHPQMTNSVVKAIEERKGSFTEESVKRAMKFIGQLKLNKKDVNTAKDLIETVRPKLLEVLTTANNASNSKVLSSLMRTVEKCADVCDPEDIEPLVKPLYEHVKASQLNMALPALKLLFAIHKKAGQIPIEFYNFLYSSLLSADFTGTSKHPQLLNFLMEALLNETNESIICNFIHRLLQVGLEMNVTFSIAVLIFMIKLFEAKPELYKIFSVENPEADKQYILFLEKQYASADAIASTDLLNPAGIESFPWILSLYTTHYHPAIRELATTLLSQNHSFEYNGDVFDDFSTTNQLHRIAHGTSTSTEENEFFNSCFREFDEIPDFPDEAFLEQMAADREAANNPQKKKNKKSTKK